MDTLYLLNEIKIEHINRLNANELSQLLHVLIQLEAKRYGLQDWDEMVPFNITTGDAGSDGRASWSGIPPRTERWLRNKLTIFQNKATSLTAPACYEEILEPKKKNSKKRKLKKQIEKLVKANGCYILFTNKSLVDNSIDKRIEKFRYAIRDAGFPNYSSLDIDVYDANKIKDWCNEYISAVTLVQQFNGIHRPQGFMIWEKWLVISRAEETLYQTNDTIQSYINQILESIIKEKVIRISGQSGLGKTRLVLEAFKNNSLRKSVVYYDLSGLQNITEIKTYLLNYQDTQDGIIVIDSCDIKSHLILSDIVKLSGNIKIITIGPYDSDSIEDSKLRFDRDNQKDIVKEIIKSKIGHSHQSNDIDYLSEICEGYPWMAKRFCESVLKTGIINFNSILPEVFIKKLLFGGEENIKEYKVIRACSVFSSFGFPDNDVLDAITKEQSDNLESQLNYIRTRILDIEISSSEFYEICQKYKRQDIIERHGVYYVVKPTVLAINLATDWLKNTPSSTVIAILTELKGSELGKKIAERIKDLDQVDKAYQIVGELWGPNGFFASAEVLNTSWGSLLFRYVVEVNPEATANALQLSFSKFSKEELLKIDEGRRNLVWALEKLCFKKASFSSAAKTLFSFAVSENETWGNNSTNQFIQLFQLFLSGTEVSLMERLDIIKWGLNKGDDDYARVAIQAIGRGLINDHYSRMGGPEKQGSSAPLHDYSPNWDEIIRYWNNILTILTEIACSNNPNALLAQEKIASSIRSLIKDGEHNLIISSIRQVMKFKRNLWPEAINNLKMTLGFEIHLPEEVVAEINSLIMELTPTDVRNQLLLKVTKPEWDSYEKDSEGHYIDIQRINAEKYAEKLIKENLSWTEHIRDLLVGEQRQAFNFGSKIGELTEHIERIIEIAITSLKEIKKENQNPELVAGILWGTKNVEFGEKIIDRFIADADLMQHSFYLIRVVNPNLINIEKLFVLIDKHGFSINNFQNFKYGNSLEKLTHEQLLTLLERIKKYGQAGRWTDLSILTTFCYNKEDRWLLYKGFIKSLISEENMIIINEETGRVERHHWPDAVLKILSCENENSFAITITNQIVEFCGKVEFGFISDLSIYLSNIMIHLIEKYFNETWEYIGQGLIGDYMTFHNLEYMIGTRNGYLDHKEGILFRYPQYYSIILAWCREHPDKAPERLAHMMPLNVTEDGKIKWHPFSKAIIDEYGENENVLSLLSSNMGTFGTTGSSVPYYMTQKILLQELIDHKLPKVREWAKSMLSYTIRAIKREKLDDEQRFIN